MSAKPSKRVLGGREKVQVAIAQKSPAFMNREASVARACAAIEEAGRNGAQLVVFPEAWLAGYPYWTEGWDSPLPQWTGGRILFRDNALVVPSEDSERIAYAVRRAGVYVALGCNEMDPRPEVPEFSASRFQIGVMRASA
jgi:nitrilase